LIALLSCAACGKTSQGVPADTQSVPEAETEPAPEMVELEIMEIGLCKLVVKKFNPKLYCKVLLSDGSKKFVPAPIEIGDFVMIEK